MTEKTKPPALPAAAAILPLCLAALAAGGETQNFKKTPPPFGLAAQKPAGSRLKALFSPKSRASGKARLRPVWTADLAQTKTLRAPRLSGSPALLTDQLVIQANSWNGIKALTKKRGRMVWEFHVEGGVFGAPAHHRKALYFGGSDGFFYKIHSETGRLIWKFWTGSENLGPPLIHEGAVYWAAASQNLYALSLEGRQLWIFPGPSLNRNRKARGMPQPAIREGLLYMGFYDGTAAAIETSSGRLKWKARLPGAAAINRGLALDGACLFAPAAGSYLFCLNPLTGARRWRAAGGGAFALSKGDYIYHGGKNFIEALNKKTGRPAWRRALKGWPAPPAEYKNSLVYGSLSSGELHIASQKDGKPLDSLLFGRGLGGPLTVDEKTGEIYLLSRDGYLHKIRADLPPL